MLCCVVPFVLLIVNLTEGRDRTSWLGVHVSQRSGS